MCKDVQYDAFSAHNQQNVWKVAMATTTSTVALLDIQRNLKDYMWGLGFKVYVGSLT